MAKGWTGSQSAGKSQLLAVYANEVVLARNVKWLKKREALGEPFVPRTMAFDSPMSPDFISKVESYGMKYLHFTNLSDALGLVEADIFIHEIIKWFPANGSNPLVPEQAEFLSQAEKEGVKLYFACQDYSQTHKHFRIHVDELYLVVKLAGSERPCRSAPPIKRIWGLVLYWPLDPKSFKSENADIVREDWWPKFYFINRDDTLLYDTSYRVRGINLPPVYYVPQDHIFLDNQGVEVDKKVKYVKR